MLLLEKTSFEVSAADDCGIAVSEWEATAKGIIEGLGLVQGNIRSIFACEIWNMDSFCK